jgi:hypothetical protein
MLLDFIVWGFQKCQVSIDHAIGDIFIKCAIYKNFNETISIGICFT